MLLDIGFHHSWGYWINDDNKQYRIRLHRTRNMFYVDMTRNGNVWIDSDALKMKRTDINLDFIKESILCYFSDGYVSCIETI